MSFADPQSVTINSVAQSMPRVGASANAGTFRGNDGLHQLDVSHQYGAKRTRHMIKLTESKIAADPYNDAQNMRSSMTAYLVVDVPIAGFTVAEQKLVVDGLVAFLSASSGARVTQLLGGEQ
jgi:hypothetical protein